MEHRLKEIKIKGTTFLLNLEKERLEQKDFRWNTIRISDMKLNGNQYFFRYDPNFRNIHFPMDDASRVMVVAIPLMKNIDPIGMTNKYKMSVDEIKHLTDQQIKHGVECHDIVDKPLRNTKLKNKIGRCKNLRF